MRYIAVKTSWTEAMQEFVENAANGKLHSLVSDPLNGTAKVTAIGDAFKVEIVYADARAQATNKSFYSAALGALQKIKTIIIKTQKKQKVNKRVVIEEQPVELPPLKEKVFTLDSISVEDAIEILEKTDYSFYVFKDVDIEDQISIVYRRNKEEFGVIRCQ